jgi:hypothetical protein
MDGKMTIGLQNREKGANVSFFEMKEVEF